MLAGFTFHSNLTPSFKIIFFCKEIHMLAICFTILYNTHKPLDQLFLFVFFFFVKHEKHFVQLPLCVGDQ